MAMRRSSRPDCTSGIGTRMAGCSARFIWQTLRSRLRHETGLARREPSPNGCGDALRIETDVREYHRRIAVIGESVGQAEMEHRHRYVGRCKRLSDRTARAARNNVFLDGDERVVFVGE